MKITLDIPDWIDKNGTLMLLNNQELVAFKMPNESWKVKTVRCNQCGECCMDLPVNHTPWGTDDEGKCNALKREEDKWICTAGYNKPFCCLSDPEDIEDLDCCIRYTK